MVLECSTTEWWVFSFLPSYLFYVCVCVYIWGVGEMQVGSGGAEIEKKLSSLMNYSLLVISKVFAR